MLECVVDDMLDEKEEISLTLNIRRSRLREAASKAHVGFNDRSEYKMRRLCFPGKTAREAWRFSERSHDCM